MVVNEELRLCIPAGLSEGREQGIDSSIATWKGEGISILIDQGMFSDPLTSYEGRADYRFDHETIDGRPARIVSFTESNGTRVFAAHFPSFRTDARLKEGLTVIIRSDPAVII
ncbi:MAG: hypothetical protein M3361_11340, partial [Candidatus Tectomicrobia bacterium]|nr:hypothetical protein [Candidatus Tectomicrobia bacterium]